jgi:hypothetical protein
VWQYDVIVVAILAFIFLTPRQIFRDQPKALQIAQLPAENGADVFWMEPELLLSVPESQRTEVASKLLKGKFGRSRAVIRLEPVFDSEKDTKGFFAYTRP